MWGINQLETGMEVSVLLSINGGGGGDAEKEELF